MLQGMVVPMGGAWYMPSIIIVCSVCSNVDGTNITQKVFSSQNELHTAKLSLSGVLKYFRGN